MINHTHLATTHSTNSQLIDWINLSYQEQSPIEHQRPHFSRPHLLTADTQTGGRGQHGRTWQSPLGNVYLSLYLPTAAVSQPNTPCLTQRLDGRLSLCVGYQISQLPVLRQINAQQAHQHLPPIGVKWVNDVGFYVNKQFQKLAGILIEPVSVAGNLLGVVVGVGFNIAFAPVLNTQTQEGLNYQAVCLQDLVQQPLQASDFYPLIKQAIVEASAQFNGFGQPSQVAQFVQDFAKVDVLAGQRLKVKASFGNQPALVGTAAGIDAQGSLQILQDNGTIAPIWTGTIHVL